MASLAAIIDVTLQQLTTPGSKYFGMRPVVVLVAMALRSHEGNATVSSLLHQLPSKVGEEQKQFLLDRAKRCDNPELLALIDRIYEWNVFKNQDELVRITHPTTASAA